MGFDTRKQKFVDGQEVVLIRDLHVGDLDLENDRVNPLDTPVLLKKGTVGIAKSNGYVEGCVTVQFEEPNPNDFSRILSEEPIREDGRWAIDRDLIKPVSSKNLLVKDAEIVIPFDTVSSLFQRKIPAGYKGKLCFDGVDGVGDVRVEGPNPDGGTQRFYIRWYEVVTSTVTLAPELLWGKFDMTKNHVMLDDSALMVVFIRDYTRNEITLGQQAPVSDTNRRMAYPGTVGKLDRLYLTSDHKRARVEWFDTSRDNPETDFWIVGIDAIAPMRDLETGEFVTYAQYRKSQEEDLGLYSVGDTATVFLGVYHTMLDDDGNLVIDEGSIDKAFRDDDEVYVLEVDTEAYKEDHDALVYQISHNEDGTGHTQWVRAYDLTDPK